MKNLLTKTLFISLLLSAVIPSGIQAVKLEVATTVIGSTIVASYLAGKADLAAKTSKKIKKAWNNKWVRYSTYGIIGTALVLTALCYAVPVPLPPGEIEWRARLLEIRDRLEKRQRQRQKRQR